MCRSFSAFLSIMLILLLSSCFGDKSNQSTKENTKLEPTTYVTRERVLITDEELEQENINTRVDELFDDFLYCFINEPSLRQERTLLIDERDSTDVQTADINPDEFEFLNSEFNTRFYTSVQDKYLNEDTTLQQAALEKIDLQQEKITTYYFMKYSGRWMMNAVTHSTFKESDLADFLYFYAKFVEDDAFQQKSLARSIHIQVTSPDEESEIIEGFVDREQWPTVSSGMPSGIVTNIRYGQKFVNTKHIMLEKVSMGNGMSETFLFSKNRRRWELTGYEN